jgi:hypothetical protein
MTTAIKKLAQNPLRAPRRKPFNRFLFALPHLDVDLLSLSDRIQGASRGNETRTMGLYPSQENQLTRGLCKKGFEIP